MKRNRRITYTAGFLYSAPIALMSYVNSSFLSTFVSQKMVGFTYVIGSILSIVMLMIAPQIFKKLGGYKFLLLIIGFDALSILWFAFSKNAISAIMAFVIGFALNIVIVFSLDEILEIFSKDSVTGKIRGIYLTICNSAWVLAQFASGTILGLFPFKGIYVIAFILMSLFFVLSFFGFKKVPDPEYDNTKSLASINRFIKNKNLLRSYSIDFLLQFFYCWMVIYTPIYLYTYLGFSWKEIGIIFMIMLLPFVIIQSPLGKYSDKIGERKILMFGFFLMAIFTISLFFIPKPELWIWAILLFVTRIGAATVEVMSDSYFFKHITPENEEFVGIYRSTSPVAYIVGPIIALMVFTFVPNFNYIFPILGMFMFYGVYLSSTIRKSDI